MLVEYLILREHNLPIFNFQLKCFQFDSFLNFKHFQIQNIKQKLKFHLLTVSQINFKMFQNVFKLIFNLCETNQDSVNLYYCSRMNILKLLLNQFQLKKQNHYYLESFLFQFHNAYFNKILNFYKYILQKAAYFFKPEMTQKPCFKIDLIPLLKRELNTAKKQQLKKILQKVSPNSYITGSKNQLIDQISKFLYAQINNYKEQLDGINKAKEFLKNWFKIQIGRIVKNIDQFEQLFKRQFQGLDIFKLSKGLRNNQTIVQNIWTEQKSQQYTCICPKGPLSLCPPKFTQICYKCGVNFHFDCLWGRSKQGKWTDTLPQCPSCFLINCLPHKKVQKVLFAGYLPTSKSNKIEFLINFKVENQLKQNKKISFQARCMRMKSQSQYNLYEITWPDNSTVILNSKKMGQFKVLPSNTPLKRRNDEQLSLDKLSIYCGSYQSLLIQEKHQYDSTANKYDYASHFVMVFAVKNQNEEDLLKKYKSSILSVKQSKQMLKNYLGSNTNNQIQIQKLSVSLKCQFYFTRITIPVRTKHCSTHFQPFDLKNFITISKATGKGVVQKYKCPICKRRAYDLVVDQYLQELINSNINNQNVKQVTFRANGQPHFEEEQYNSDNQSEQQEKTKLTKKNELQKIGGKQLKGEQLSAKNPEISHQDGQVELIDLQEFDKKISISNKGGGLANQKRNQPGQLKRNSPNQLKKNQLNQLKRNNQEQILSMKRNRAAFEKDQQYNQGGKQYKKQELQKIRKQVKTNQTQALVESLFKRHLNQKKKIEEQSMVNQQKSQYKKSGDQTQEKNPKEISLPSSLFLNKSQILSDKFISNLQESEKNENIRSFNQAKPQSYQKENLKTLVKKFVVQSKQCNDKKIDTNANNQLEDEVPQKYKVKQLQENLGKQINSDQQRQQINNAKFQLKEPYQQLREQASFIKSKLHAHSSQQSQSQKKLSQYVQRIAGSKNSSQQLQKTSKQCIQQAQPICISSQSESQQQQSAQINGDLNKQVQLVSLNKKKHTHPRSKYFPTNHNTYTVRKIIERSLHMPSNRSQNGKIRIRQQNDKVPEKNRSSQQANDLREENKLSQIRKLQIQRQMIQDDPEDDKNSSSYEYIYEENMQSLQVQPMKNKQTSKDNENNFMKKKKHIQNISRHQSDKQNRKRLKRNLQNKRRSRKQGIYKEENQQQRDDEDILYESENIYQELSRSDTIYEQREYNEQNDGANERIHKNQNIIQKENESNKNIHDKNQSRERKTQFKTNSLSNDIQKVNKSIDHRNCNRIQISQKLIQIVQNNYNNPIQLQQQQQEKDNNYEKQQIYNEQQYQIQKQQHNKDNISNHINSISINKQNIQKQLSKQQKYIQQLNNLRDQIEKSRKNIQKLSKHYKMEPIKDQEEKLFIQTLEELNIENNDEIFT